jgi:hypothetical protein
MNMSKIIKIYEEKEVIKFLETRKLIKQYVKSVEYLIL